ncbi:DM13 domain-containing protein [Sediminibacterium goheungense]|uniref:Electron transfer DM13 n=1 Tax=Sediminibacterium goheungense TaxID=1086393 RepID=A0A4R6J0Q1_9BACT|nr:DM13 domain-containing protein [Sediminibacterium goheungense]TDO28723.1 electron transfer DM13 [Sediminibacterium goheungense]
MKVIGCFFAVVLGLSACTKESDALKAALQTNNSPVTAPIPVQPALKRGVLYSTSGIQVMGVVKIIQQASGLQVQLDSFSVSAGPDLKVYLSQAATPGNHLNLGNLQSNSGTQYYNIPAGTNLSAYPFVLIHCQQYNHLFSYASIQ